MYEQYDFDDNKLFDNLYVKGHIDSHPESHQPSHYFVYGLFTLLKLVPMMCFFIPKTFSQYKTNVKLN